MFQARVSQTPTHSSQAALGKRILQQQLYRRLQQLHNIIIIIAAAAAAAAADDDDDDDGISGEELIQVNLLRDNNRMRSMVPGKGTKQQELR